MLMTLSAFVKERLAFTLESEEYLINKNKESGLKGNGVNDEGQVVFRDENDNWILLEDMVRIEDNETLYSMYPKLDKEIIDTLRKSFYSLYSFIDPKVYYSRLTRSVEDNIKEEEYWEGLIDGLF